MGRTRAELDHGAVTDVTVRVVGRLRNLGVGRTSAVLARDPGNDALPLVVWGDHPPAGVAWEEDGWYRLHDVEVVRRSFPVLQTTATTTVERCESPTPAMEDGVQIREDRFRVYETDDGVARFRAIGPGVIEAGKDWPGTLPAPGDRARALERERHLGTTYRVAVEDALDGALQSGFEVAGVLSADADGPTEWRLREGEVVRRTPMTFVEPDRTFERLEALWQRSRAAEDDGADGAPPPAAATVTGEDGPLAALHVVPDDRVTADGQPLWRALSRGEHALTEAVVAAPPPGSDGSAVDCLLLRPPGPYVAAAVVPPGGEAFANGLRRQVGLPAIHEAGTTRRPLSAVERSPETLPARPLAPEEVDDVAGGGTAPFAADRAANAVYAVLVVETGRVRLYGYDPSTREWSVVAVVAVRPGEELVDAAGRAVADGRRWVERTFDRELSVVEAEAIEAVAAPE